MGKGEVRRGAEWGMSAWMCEGAWGAEGGAPGKLQTTIRLERKL